MTEPKIVASTRSRPDPSGHSSPDATGPWLVLGWVGLAFLTIGGADFALTWLPTGFGNREWEFGTVTQSLNALPIVLLGIGLTTAAGEQVGRRWWSLVGGIAAGLLLAWVLLAVVLWALSVQLAFATVPDNLALGLRKAALKTSLQSLVYPAVLFYLLRRAWLGFRGRGSDGTG